MKKFLSFVCILAMLCAVVCVPSGAAEPSFSVKVVSTPHQIGEKAVSVDVVGNIASGSTLGAFALVFKYDAAYMNIDSVKTNDALGGVFVESPNLSFNPYKITWAGIDGVAAGEDFVIATFDFTLITESEPEDEFLFDIEFVDGNNPVDVDGNDLSCAANDLLLKAERVYPQGDVNNDNVVSLLDAIAIMKVNAKWTGYSVNEYIADVNKDGRVNLNDVTLILKYIAKWNVELK